jgi:hypothetical protein
LLLLFVCFFCLLFVDAQAQARFKIGKTQKK